MPSDPLPDFPRTLETLADEATRSAERGDTALDLLLTDAQRLLRAIAWDFSFHAGHNPACDSLHWEKRECDCEVAKKLARWRLP